MSTYITKLAKERGLKIVDGKKPLKLEVTGSDVRQALQKNSKCCAFSRAAKRNYDVSAAYFFRQVAYLEYPTKLVRFILPPSMQKEIVSFDRAKTMSPGVYQLSAPGPGNRQEDIRARSKKRPGRHKPGNTKVTRKVRHRTQGIRTMQEPA